MNISTSIKVKHKKRFGTKTEKRTIIISDTDILNYFEYVATPYDLKYLCSHIYDTSLIKSWIQRIAIYTTTGLDAKNSKVIEFEIAESDIDKVVEIIKNLADKREITISKKY